MNKSKMSAKQIAATEYRAAKAHLESLLGSEKELGLAIWLRNMVTDSTVIACEIKRYYSFRGADVSYSAEKTIAYARMARAYTAWSLSLQS